MGCEQPGTLRAFLDDELDPQSTARVAAHLAVCGDCKQTLARLRDTAAVVARCLSVLDEEELPRMEVATTSASDARRSRPGVRDAAPMGGAQSAGQSLTRRLIMRLYALSFRQQAAVAAVFVAALLVAFVTWPPGRALAVEFLNLFRVQRFAVVTIDPTQPFDPMQHLEQLGTVSIPDRDYSGRALGSIEQASAFAGITVRQPSRLPDGLSGQPRIFAYPAAEASFTLDRQRAEAYLQSVGASDVSVPTSLDGARLVVRVPAAVLLAYGADANSPVVAIGQLASPTAVVEGNASLAELREFLLSVPGLPSDTIQQLRAIDDWTATLPVPLPRDHATWREVPVDGTTGLLVTLDGDDRFTGIVWQRDGVVTTVAGTVGEQELLDIAASLQ